MFYSRYRRNGDGSLGQTARTGLLALFVLAGLVACGKEETAKPAASSATPAAGASPEVTPSASQEVKPASVPELLADAKKAYTEDRLVAPAGDNAFEYYLAVRAMEEANVASAQALVDLFPLGVSVAEREIAARNFEEANRIIGLLDQSSPGSYTVSKLKSRLSSGQIQQQREEERRLASEVATAQAAREEQVAAAQAAAPPPAPRPAREPQPTPVEPQPAVATPPKPVETAPTGVTKDAVLVRQVQPAFPALALRRRLSGWVEVRFTVGADGKVGQVTVTQSEPQRLFDREATRAVQQWVFEPALRNGVPVSSTVSRRIEFRQDGG
ncbi:MAG: energy transducer TonB [Lysobacterales bacterium]